MRQQFEGGVCRDQQTCSYDNQHYSPFIITRMNIARAHTYIAVDPLPCGKISRVVMICWKVRRDFEGSDNSMCSEISRKYNMLQWILFKFCLQLNQGQLLRKNIVAIASNYSFWLPWQCTHTSTCTHVHGICNICH